MRNIFAALPPHLIQIASNEVVQLFFYSANYFSREYFSFRKSWELYLGKRSLKDILVKLYVRSNIYVNVSFLFILHAKCERGFVYFLLSANKFIFSKFIMAYALDIVYYYREKILQGVLRI